MSFSPNFPVDSTHRWPNYLFKAWSHSLLYIRSSGLLLVSVVFSAVCLGDYASTSGCNLDNTNKIQTRKAGLNGADLVVEIFGTE